MARDRVGGLYQSYKTGRGILREVLGWVGRPSGRCRTGRGTILEVQDGSKDCLGGSGRSERSSGMFKMGRGPSRKFGTGWGTLPEFRNGTGDPLEGPGRVGGPTVGSERVEGPSRSFGMGRGTLPEVRDG